MRVGKARAFRVGLRSVLPSNAFRIIQDVDERIFRARGEIKYRIAYRVKELNTPRAEAIQYLARPNYRETAVPVPRIIWCYWHDGDPPEVVQRCLESIRANSNGAPVNVLDGASVSAYLPQEVLNRAKGLGHAHAADLYRLELLRLYGGLWLDASVYLTGNIDWSQFDVENNPVDLYGYYNESFGSSVGEFPVVENWFLAAPEQSPLIKEWLDEFYYAVDVGFPKYIEELRLHSQSAKILQNIENPSYLAMHCALQKVLLQQVHRYCYKAVRAEDRALRLRTAGAPRWTQIGMRMFFGSAEISNLNVIKLTKLERELLSTYRSWSTANPRSFAFRFWCS